MPLLPREIVALNGKYIKVRVYFAGVPFTWNQDFALRERVVEVLCVIASSTGTLPVAGDKLTVERSQADAGLLSCTVESRNFELAEEADQLDNILPDLLVKFSIRPDINGQSEPPAGQ